MPERPLDPSERECEVFCAYLIDGRPTEYVQRKYALGHGAIPFRRGANHTRFDERLVALARRGPWFTRIADAYARFFRPTSPLRQKLVLLVAILENAPPSHTYLNSAEASGPLAAAIRALVSGTGFVLALLVGMVLLGPWQLAASSEPAATGPGGSDHG